MSVNRPKRAAAAARPDLARRGAAVTWEWLSDAVVLRAFRFAIRQQPDGVCHWSGSAGGPQSITTDLATAVDHFVCRRYRAAAHRLEVAGMFGDARKIRGAAEDQLKPLDPLVQVMRRRAAAVAPPAIVGGREALTAQELVLANPLRRRLRRNSAVDAAAATVELELELLLAAEELTA